MNTTPPGFFQRVFNVRVGEGRTIGLLFAFYFLLMSGVVFVQTGAFGLFVAEFGAQNLPFAYIAIAVLASVVAVAFLKLAERVSPATVLFANLVFVAVGCAIFWFGLKLPVARIFIFFLPVWFQIQINLADVAVWPLAVRLFDVRQGKRLFGLVAAGDWLANIVVGLVVVPLVGLIGVVNLPLLSIVCVAAAAVVLHAIARAYLRQPLHPVSPRRLARKPAPLSSLMRSRYVVSIIGYVLLWWIAFFFVDNIFYERAGLQFPDGAELTSFIGTLLSATGVVGLIAAGFLSSLVLTRFGLRTGLLIMPVLVTVFVALVAISGTLGSANAGVALALAFGTLAKLTNVAIGFSITQSANSVMYQALPADQRTRIQTVAQTIVQPIAIGIAGALLLVLNTVFKLNGIGFAIVFLGIAVVWIGIILAIARGYPAALTQVLAKRQLDDVPVTVDTSSVAVLQNALHGASPGAVIYAFNMLEQVDARVANAALSQLLAHASPEVRREAWAHIEKLDSAHAASLPLRATLQQETTPEVKAVALTTMASLGQMTTDELESAMRDEDPRVRLGALTGLVKLSQADDVSAAYTAILRLVQSPDVADRELAAHALADAGTPRFAGLVRTLLHDDSVAVRRIALQAAGHLNEPALWLDVVSSCDDSATARTAEAALVQASTGVRDGALPVIKAAIDAGVSRSQSLSLARVCGRIGNSQAQQILLGWAATPYAELRSQVLAALVHCGYRVQSAQEAHSLAQTEAEFVARIAGALADVQTETHTDTRSLVSALNNELADARERMLDVLALSHDANTIRRVRNAWATGDPSQRAYALEVIDVHLPTTQKHLVLPVIEDISPLERVAKLQPHFPQLSQPPQPPQTIRTLQDCVRDVTDGQLATQVSPWTRECAAFIADKLRATEIQGESTMLSTVERVMILKSASVFANTPDRVLAGVAALLEEIDMGTDESVFEKGEEGDSMYLIVGGRVRVHDGERVLNDLGDGEVFGEMALLDPAPRLATVTALEPTRLLQLERAPFFELINERPEIAIGIIGLLASRLRARVQDLSDLDARVRELERVKQQI